MSKFLQWVGSIALAAIMLAAAYFVVMIGVNVVNTGKLPTLTSKTDSSTSPIAALTNITVKVVAEEKVDPTEPSDKITVLEDSYVRRDTSGIPEITEWADLARKVDEEVPQWLVPVQRLKGIPYLATSEEIGEEPTVVVPDVYRGLYRWHQVTPKEAGVMNVVLHTVGKPDENFSFQKQTLRFIGKVWVLEKVEAVLETPAAVIEMPLSTETVEETPAGTVDVTGPPEP